MKFKVAPKRGRRRTAFRLLVPLLASGLPLSLSACDAFRLPDPDVRYLAFGDSTTAGPTDQDYHEFLRDKLGEPANSFANEGEGGEDTESGLERLRELIDRDLYPNAEYFFYWEGGGDIIDFIRGRDPLLALSPDDPEYPFAASLDDSLDSIQDRIEFALSLARAQGWQVFAATYYAINDDVNSCPPLLLDVIIPSQAANANAYLDLLNDRIRTAASRQGVTLVDIATWNTLLLSEPDGYFNCNHLSESGNAIVGQVFFDAVSESSD